MKYVIDYMNNKYEVSIEMFNDDFSEMEILKGIEDGMLEDMMEINEDINFLNDKNDDFEVKVLRKL